MRPLSKAVAIVLASSLVLGAILAYAVVREGPRLTSGDVLAATRTALANLVERAVAQGGLDDAVAAAEASIRDALAARGHSVPAVRVVRYNDFNPLAAFFFDVQAGDVTARFVVDGLADPLRAMRTGEWVLLRQGPFHPYERHADSAVLALCLARTYFHFAEDGPDLFARLENRTDDPYYYGFESLVTDGGATTADHLLFATGRYAPDPFHRAVYGLE
jgi:hypothetical protein